MKVYLDNCCFNRPFDDQSQIRIRIETEAKLYIQSKIEEGSLLIAWSYVLDFENAMNPFEIRKITINRWKRRAFQMVVENEDILVKARELTKLQLKAKDALHIACALEAKCGHFLTTDDKVLSRGHLIEGLNIVNPIEMLQVIEE